MINQIIIPSSLSEIENHCHTVSPIFILKSQEIQLIEDDKNTQLYASLTFLYKTIDSSEETNAEETKKHVVEFFKINNGVDVFISFIKHFQSNQSSNFTKGILFKIFHKLIMIFWKISDEYLDVVEQLIERKYYVCGFGYLAKQSLSACFENSTSTRDSRNFLMTCHGIIGILHNLISKNERIRPLYLEQNAIKKLKPFYDEPKVYTSLKTAALFLISFLFEDQKNLVDKDQFKLDGKHAKYIIHIINDCLQDNEDFSQEHGYHLDEPLKACINISGNEHNENLLIQAGILKIIDQILFTKKTGNKKDKEILEITWKLLWQLSFTKSFAEQVFSKLETPLTNTDDTNSVPQADISHAITYRTDANTYKYPKIKDEILRKRPLSSNFESIYYSHIASAIKANLDGYDQANQLRPKKNLTNTHVMISYNHSYKSLIMKLTEHLKNKGYNIWIDQNFQMGSFIDQMAYAVENSAVIVAAVCAEFLRSPHCRQEMRYAYHLEKKCVRIIVERNLSLNGWAYLLTSHCDAIDFFSNETLELDDATFAKCCDELTQSLGDLGKSSGGGVGSIVVPHSFNVPADSAHGNEHSNMASPGKQSLITCKSSPNRMCSLGGSDAADTLSHSISNSNVNWRSSTSAELVRSMSGGGSSRQRSSVTSLLQQQQQHCMPALREMSQHSLVSEMSIISQNHQSNVNTLESLDPVRVRRWLAELFKNGVDKPVFSLLTDESDVCVEAKQVKKEDASATTSTSSSTGEIELTGVAEQDVFIQNMNANQLIELCNIFAQSPEYFYTILQRDLRVSSFVDRLRIAAEFRNLLTNGFNKN